MPFTAPSTYPSQANSGYASEFLIGSPLAAIAEVKTFSADFITMGEIDTTHLLSPGNTSEFIPGVIKPGKLSFAGNFIGDATQESISILAQARTIFPFSIIAPVQRLGKTYTVTGNGYFTSYKVGPFEVDKAIEFQAEIQMTGLATFAVA